VGEGRGDALKRLLLILPVAVLLAGAAAIGQEKTAAQASYSPTDIKILGTLNSGQTSKPVEYSRLPQYRAFVFEGNGHDQVEITVVGGNRNAFVALADSTLTPIASGVGRLSATLPYHGPDTEAFYILFKGNSGQPAQLAIHFKKTAGSAQPADATR
jgi:hypothetical protein